MQNSNAAISQPIISHPVTPLTTAPSRVSAFLDNVRSFYLLNEPVTGDRRECHRMNVTMPVRVTPLVGNTMPPISHNGISRDISDSGIGVVLNDPIDAESAILELQPLNGPAFEVRAKVAYCREVGFYFHIGFEFDDSPAQN